LPRTTTRSDASPPVWLLPILVLGYLVMLSVRLFHSPTCLLACPPLSFRRWGLLVPQPWPSGPVRALFLVFFFCLPPDTRSYRRLDLVALPYPFFASRPICTGICRLPRPRIFRRFTCSMNRALLLPLLLLLLLPPLSFACISSPKLPSHNPSSSGDISPIPGKV